MNKRYKYLYEIKQTNPQPEEAIYYRGSRVSKVPPEQDFWIKYFTSSDLIKKKIKEQGKDAFEIVEIKTFPEEVDIRHQEYLYLVEVDARNNPLYFNQSNNETHSKVDYIKKICPHCYRKNYGNPFEKCSYCHQMMSLFKCHQCGRSIPNPATRCVCGYSKVDTSDYRCVKCGSELKSANERCKCGYSRIDHQKHSCKKCGSPLKFSNERCSCGYSRVDDAQYQCAKCGNRLGNPTERCSCGYSRIDDANHKCKKCGKPLSSSNERCECGYSRVDGARYQCPQCQTSLKSSNIRCPKCGYTRMKEVQFFCQKCNQAIDNPTSRCVCGYSLVDDIQFKCQRCEAFIPNPTSRCQCGYSILDEVTYTCEKCERPLKTFFERCVCGYSKGDDSQFKCLNCGTAIEKSKSICPRCQITHAGCQNWKIYNPVYKLSLNEKLVFQGYRHLCVQYMAERLICHEDVARKWLKGSLVIFEPKQDSKKYLNKMEYAGLRAELVSDSSQNEVLNQ